MNTPCLQGESVLPSTTDEARQLIGRRVIYLRHQDIDRSGRGYFFPRYGKITGAFRRVIVLDDGDYVGLRDLSEMVLNPQQD